MAKITFQEAPVKLTAGIVGVGEHHDNHWGRMLVLKLLRLPGTRYLLIESAPDQQGTVDAISGTNGTFNPDMAKAFDRIGWKTEGVLPISMVVYQAQRHGVRVVCADHNCVYSGAYAVGRNGMNKRNEAAVDSLLALDKGSGLSGVIMLNGVDHFVGSNATSISKRLEAKNGVVFNWVDASTKDGSGFGVVVN
jgi:hypothetical protein